MGGFDNMKSIRNKLIAIFTLILLITSLALGVVSIQTASNKLIDRNSIYRGLKVY